jgi:formate dehydrogenase assembly factor FdhD
MKRSPRSGTVVAQNTANRGSYVVCLDCGTEFVYDWTTMRVGSPIETRVTAAPVVAVPQTLREVQPMFR